MTYENDRKLLERLIDESTDNIIIANRYIEDWQKIISESKNEKARQILYVIFPNKERRWKIFAVPSDASMLVPRKPFPEEWRGKKQELAAITGIKTAVSCHKAGFTALATTKSDAIKLAKLSIKTAG